MNEQVFDAIIIGGSYSGLAAGMALGRALKRVLIIDSGRPCNRNTPYSHNFLTQDGKPPGEIGRLAREQLGTYRSVQFFDGLVTDASKNENGFVIKTESGESFNALKLIFATGISDMLPDISGFEECWGISVLHCPYCHGYEVRDEATGIVGNGEYGFDFARLISNWTRDLTLFTNGKSTLTEEQRTKLQKHNIQVVEKRIRKLEHTDGYLTNIRFTDDSVQVIKAIYTRVPFKQHCPVPEILGCELTPEGYIKVDPSNRTTLPGVYACGDNAGRMRTVANAVAMGTTTGMMVNKELVDESF